mmetsp:Transcript_53561/g.64596  ORF Transcript_53561/g.64596 Transcript_53561/m.64596 type:complete len:141 (-) Transcript_53561:45-467(-)|eukprot:CAMPEP_0172514204 /NCGR_PEP_ID=MMETSP1066-20121228/258187_1 /TAXON_ID=671091 /ORGANISM="Coscinodiscus wailesii, Strain CCMP2513" /LENGTH=140 /DNA_ID=CAMNT_0013294773 /DNA_START=65 /DNA_END=487 /DNA_ORIENTATION=+
MPPNTFLPQVRTRIHFVLRQRHFATSGQKRQRRGKKNTKRNAAFPKNQGSSPLAAVPQQQQQHLSSRQLNRTIPRRDNGNNESGYNPALLWLGVFPVVATGCLVAVREDFREQVFGDYMRARETYARKREEEAALRREGQ